MQNKTTTLFLLFWLVGQASGQENEQPTDDNQSRQSMSQQIDTDVTEELSELKVTASTSGLISYVSATGAKTDTPIVETPSAISVLTAERFEDLGAETLQDAMGYVSGVFNGPYGVDSRGDWSQVRSVSPVQYLDGLRMLFGYYNNTRPNPYGFQQVEILKGPSSVLFGQGSTGGIVNIVSKRPQAESSHEIWGQIGQYDRLQLALDLTGSIDNNAKFLYRFVGLARDSETQTDFVDDNSLVLSPSLTWFITDQTELTALGHWQKNESGSTTQFFPQMGTRLPAPNGPIPVNRFVSEPDFDRYDSEQQALTLLLNHDFMNDWSVNVAARFSESEVDYRTMYGWPPVFQDDNRSILRSAYISDNSADAFTTDMRLHGDKLWGQVQHKMVFGIDYQNVTTDNDSVFVYNGGGLLDLYNPVYGQVTNLPTPADIINTPASQIYQTGLYLQDQMYFGDHWIVSAALRRDVVKNKTESTESFESKATTGRFGVMYRFDNNISPYANYSESFEPLAGFDAYGKPFEPKKGEQFEFGVKYQPKGTEHLVTASVFNITENNRTTPLSADLLTDPNITDPTASIQVGEVEIQGFELEAQLEWSEFDVYSSYSYTDSEVTKSNTSGELGARLAATPDHLFSTWVTYRPEQFLPGLKLGGGIRYVGETSDGSAFVALPNGTVVNDPLLTQSYTLFDMMIGYEKGAYDFSLNVDNLTDKRTTTSCLARGDCFYGQQRTITASVKYKF